MPANDQSSGANAGFPATQWSLVLGAAEPDSHSAREALEALCRQYWMPLYAFARRLGQTAAAAEDSTQSFFQHVLESGWLRKIQPTGGRFRSVLLVSFKHFLADERERGRAQKRGGGRVVFPLDTAAIEAGLESTWATAPPSEAVYDRAWAIATVNLALSQLEAEFVAGDRHRLFETLKPFLEGDAEAPGYAEVAQQLGTTKATIAVTVSRMRQRYRELLRASVAQTVATPAEVEEELRHLLAALIGR